MACEDCPETPIVPPADNKPFMIVYTGGPPHAQYLALRQALPARDPNVIPQYGVLTITDQGWLQYKDGQDTKAPAGWEEVEPGLYRPTWIPCAHRTVRGQMLDSGLLTLACSCFDPRTGRKFKDQLVPSDCEQCQWRTPIQ
jgi:hypothetical protein